MCRNAVGQYDKSVDGKLPGYLDNESVQKANDQSRQITFAQTVVFVNNSRWNGVPCICKCGKALHAKNTEVRIQFKADGLTLFGESTFTELAIRLQANEAIWLKVNTKTQGFAGVNSGQEYGSDLAYQNGLGDAKLPEARTRLILDCLEGDQALFVRDTRKLEICTPLLHQSENAKEKPASFQHKQKQRKERKKEKKEFYSLYF